MGRYTFLVEVDNDRIRKSVNANTLSEARHLLNVMYPYATNIQLLS